MKITGDDKLDPVEVVNQFAASDTKVLLATDKIQFGVNIQCAKVVINYELPLKPSTSQQRIGRSYRTGQTKDVLAISLVTKDSVEEIIYEQFKTKEHVITTMVENLDTIGHVDDEFISDVSSKLKKHLGITGEFDYEKFD
jgi:SNF2 family DNA or RNA helicase